MAPLPVLAAASQGPGGPRYVAAQAPAADAAAGGRAGPAGDALPEPAEFGGAMGAPVGFVPPRPQPLHPGPVTAVKYFS